MSIKRSAPVQALLPYLRAIRYERLRRQALRAARTPAPGESHADQPGSAFLMGSGRSGTTLLGRLFEHHPEVRYLFEPYHAWAAIEPRSDVTNFHVKSDGQFFMDASLATADARTRFVRTMLAPVSNARRRLLVEKTPHNVCRIGFIEALVPDPSRTNYVHIVRDGVDIARSIDRLATTGTYRIAGKPDYNQWWGRGRCKWKSLARDGAAHGYFPQEIGALTSDAQRGAYEWLCSIGEADVWRDRLGSRMIEIRYPDLTSRPRDIVADVCQHLGISCEPEWLERAIAPVQSERRNKGPALALPPGMAARFNALQERFGFEGRATSA